MLTAAAVASEMVLVSFATFLPAAEGRPTWLSIIGSRISSTPRPPQPEACGADQLFSTNSALLICNSVLSSLNSASPPKPVIGAVPAGGLVVPVVRFQSNGEPEEPM